MDEYDSFDYSGLNHEKKAALETSSILNPFPGAAGQTFWLGPDEADALEFKMQQELEGLRAESTNNAA